MPKAIPCVSTPQKRSEIGRTLQDLVRAGLDQRGNIESWWATCEKYHRQEFNLEGTSDDGDAGVGLSECPITISQTRLEMLAAMMCSVIVRPDPYMLCEEDAPKQITEKKEKMLHRFWRVARFEPNIREAACIVEDTNIVFWRLAWDPSRLKKPYGGLLMDIIPPRDSVIFPCTRGGIDAARIIGHRFYTRQSQIEYLQSTGVYFDDAQIRGGDSLLEHDTGGESQNARTEPDVFGPDSGDHLVECFDLCFLYADRKAGEKPQPEKWYRVIIAFKQAAILSFEEYPYSVPWYFVATLKTTSRKDFWPGDSVSRSLSISQDTANKIGQALYNGATASAVPPTFGPPTDDQIKDNRLTAGQYVETDAPPNSFWSPPNNFRGQELFNFLTMVREEADQIAKVSANTMGTNQPSETTATETSIIASGVSTATEEYISNFSAPLGEMAGFTCELLFKHWSEWGPRWADSLGISIEDLARPAIWETNGKSTGNTPGAILQFLAGVLKAYQTIGPASGLDPYEFMSLYIAQSEAVGANKLQSTKEELQAMQSQPPKPPPPTAQPTAKFTDLPPDVQQQWLVDNGYQPSKLLDAQIQAATQMLGAAGTGADTGATNANQLGALVGALGNETATGPAVGPGGPGSPQVPDSGSAGQSSGPLPGPGQTGASF